MIYHQTDRYTLYQGNALDILKELAEHGIVVNASISSSPYYAMRNYKASEGLFIPPTSFETDPNCDHEWNEGDVKGQSGGMNSPHLVRKGQVNFQLTQSTDYRLCSRCGSFYGTLGWEPSANLYISHLGMIYDALGNIMSDPSNLFVNLANKYSGNTAGGGGSPLAKTKFNQIPSDIPPVPDNTYKSGCIIPIPDLMKLEMINRGWIYRSEIIWAKGIDGDAATELDYWGNPMPGSYKNRPIYAHEDVLFLTKNKSLWDWYGAYVRTGESSGHRLRDVLLIKTEPSTHSHVAPYPIELCLTLLSATELNGGRCSKCKVPYRRKTKREEVKPGELSYNTKYEGIEEELSSSGRIQARLSGLRGVGMDRDNPFPKYISLGFFPRCKCEAGSEPCVVLDPFHGSGTTGRAALRLGHHYIGIDISEKYLEESVPYLEAEVKGMHPKEYRNSQNQLSLI